MKKKIIFIIFINLLFFCALTNVLANDLHANGYSYLQCFYEVGKENTEDADYDKSIVEFRVGISTGVSGSSSENMRMIIDGKKYAPTKNLDSNPVLHYVDVDRSFGFVNFPDEQTEENYNIGVQQAAADALFYHILDTDECKSLYIYEAIDGYDIKIDNGNLKRLKKNLYIIASKDDYLEQDLYVAKVLNPILSYHSYSPEGYIDDVEFLNYEEAKDSKDKNEEAPVPSTSTDNSCTYNFGTNAIADLTEDEKKKVCNFTTDFKWTQTTKVRNDYTGETVPFNDYSLKITENFSGRETFGSSGELQPGVEVNAIRLDTDKYGSLSLSVDRSLLRETHTSEVPGSCLDNSKVFAYYNGSGYVLTLDVNEAEEKSKLNYYCDGSGNLIKIAKYTDGTPVSGCDVVPEVVRKWIKIVLNFVKYVALVLVIVLGTIDFIKAAAQGEPDSMKKAGQAFLKRVVAVILLFLLPMLVEFILNLINLYGSTGDCFGIYE